MKHYIYFERISHPGSGFKFECNAEGRIDVDSLTARQKVNLDNCMSNRWQEYATPRVMQADDCHSLT